MSAAIWEIGGSVPYHDNDGNKRYPSHENKRLFVVAETMERSMELARERFPELTFHVISKRNRVYSDGGVIVDSELQQL